MKHRLTSEQAVWYFDRAPICKCKMKCILKQTTTLGYYYECPVCDRRWHLRTANANLSIGRVPKTAAY